MVNRDKILASIAADIEATKLALEVNMVQPNLRNKIALESKLATLERLHESIRIGLKYVWYKLESHFGPGHQGTEIRYFYSTGILDRSTRKEIESAVNSRYDSESCFTRLRIVKSVPPEEIARLHANAQRTIRNSKTIIAALKELDKLGKA